MFQRKQTRCTEYSNGPVRFKMKCSIFLNIERRTQSSYRDRAGGDCTSTPSQFPATLWKSVTATSSNGEAGACFTAPQAVKACPIAAISTRHCIMLGEFHAGLLYLEAQMLARRIMFRLLPAAIIGRFSEESTLSL